MFTLVQSFAVSAQGLSKVHELQKVHGAVQGLRGRLRRGECFSPPSPW